MAPLLGAARTPCINDWIASNSFHYSTWLVVIIVVVTVIYRSLPAFARFRSRRTMSTPSPTQEKEKRQAASSSKRVDSGMTEEQNQRLQALRRELAQHQETVTPIHPWIAPPTPLPGPYDAPFYPLPMPTLRKHSQDPPPPFPEDDVVTYTHQVASPSSPAHETVLPIRGTTTVSNHGWKRTQWTVTAG